MSRDYADRWMEIDHSTRYNEPLSPEERRAAKGFLALLLGAFLMGSYIGISKHKEEITEGIIYEKVHEPARYVVDGGAVVPIGEIGVPVMTQSYDDEDFVINIKANIETLLGTREITRRFEVPKGKFNRLKIGDKVKYNKKTKTLQKVR